MRCPNIISTPKSFDLIKAKSLVTSLLGILAVGLFLWKMAAEFIDLEYFNF